MQKYVIALGFFDGVHLGHGGLLRRTKELAQAHGLIPAAFTLDPHPSVLFSPHPVGQLTTLELREELMRKLYGIEKLFVLPFTPQSCTQPWDEFTDELLIGKYHGAYFVSGRDYRFGDRGEGTPERLAEKCRTLGRGYDCVDDIFLEGRKVSSTYIRSLLESGEMAKAVRFLGHPHLLRGVVVPGQHLGRTLGIPTANLQLPLELLLPRFGVYAARAYFDGQERLAVVNVGHWPTVDGETVTVEPWLLDFDGDLYGHTVTLALYDFLRPEQKFPSLAALTAAIRQNADQTREFFQTK